MLWYTHHLSHSLFVLPEFILLSIPAQRYALRCSSCKLIMWADGKLCAYYVSEQTYCPRWMGHCDTAHPTSWDFGFGPGERSKHTAVFTRGQMHSWMYPLRLCSRCVQRSGKCFMVVWNIRHKTAKIPQASTFAVC